MNEIIQNAAKITDKDKVIYIKSAHRHDFVSYSNESGSFAIDGGTAYLRRNYSSSFDFHVECYSLNSDSPEEEIQNKLLWGTYGKNGDEELKYLPIKDLEYDHLLAIFKTQQISGIYLKTIKYWLKKKSAAL